LKVFLIAFTAVDISDVLDIFDKFSENTELVKAPTIEPLDISDNHRLARVFLLNIFADVIELLYIHWIMSFAALAGTQPLDQDFLNLATLSS